MDGVKDEVATEDGNINNDECCPEKIISNHIKPNKEKGSVETIIAKVKSPSKLKRKKEHHLGVVSGAEGEVVRDAIFNIDDDKTISKKKIKPNEELKKEDDEISDENVKSPPNEKRSEHLQDNVQGVEQTTPDRAKKVPSRSAKRKKAKRHWLQELAKIQKMEGFVLPPSESTRMLKDKEVLCVKREEMALTEEMEVNRKEPVNNGMILLPKEELEDETSLVEIVSKKRKASTKLLNPKSEHLHENVQGVEQASTSLDGAKKVPSRSARRKKAKKQWLQELAKTSQKMEGFVLPQSESTRILKDKEVLCVKREEMGLAEAIEGADAGNLVDYVKVNRKEPVNNGMLLLPKKEVEDEPSLVETVSKKRKASTKLLNPKSEHLHENVQGVEQASTSLDGAKKVPSRSARRKKAKKQWLQELAKTSQKMGGFVLPYSESTRILKDKEVLCVKREEMDLAEAIEGEESDAGNLVDFVKVNRKEPVNNGMILLEIKEEKLEDEPSPITDSTKSRSSRSEHLEENVEGVEQASTAPDGAKKVPSRSARRKKAKRQWERELAKIRKMEGFVLPPSELTRILKDMEVFWKGVALNEAIEGADAGNLVDYAEVNRKESVKSEHLQENVQGVEQASTSLDGAKKVPSRSARRKKVKKQWKRKLAKISQKEANGVHPKGLEIDFIDFDKLPVCISPKEGDVIAYRVVELSSSWTPELSSYRVGKISHFDSDNIVLNPVPEYPIVFDKMDEDGPDNYSLYEEDGSLEIKFAGLVDVRSVKQSNDTDLIEIKVEREWN